MQSAAGPRDARLCRGAAHPLLPRSGSSASAADRARRQLLVGSGDVTLRGQRLPGSAADVRLGRRGRDAVRHGRTPHDDGEDTQEQCNATLGGRFEQCCADLVRESASSGTAARRCRIRSVSARQRVNTSATGGDRSGPQLFVGQPGAFPRQRLPVMVGQLRQHGGLGADGDRPGAGVGRCGRCRTWTLTATVGRFLSVRTATGWRRPGVAATGPPPRSGSSGPACLSGCPRRRGRGLRCRRPSASVRPGRAGAPRRSTGRCR